MAQRATYKKANPPRVSMLEENPTNTEETMNEGLSSSKPEETTEDLKIVEQETKQAEPVVENDASEPKEEANTRANLKIMEPGKTLLATNQPKINGHITTVKIFFGNFVTPMMKDTDGNWEFRRLNEKKYNKVLIDFLSSTEGSEYKQPTEEEIEEANRIVLQKEKAYLKKLQTSSKAEERVEVQQEETVPETKQDNELDTGKQPLPQSQSKKLETIETDVKPSDLKYVDDTLSYTEEQIEKYRKRGFTQPQLEQIEIGLRNEVDVTQYAFKDMSANQMERQRKILQERQGLHNEAEDRFGQDYSEEKSETIEDKLAKLEEKEYSGVKALGNAALVIIFSLLVVALCIVLVTILIKAFKLYSKGL